VSRGAARRTRVSREHRSDECPATATIRARSGREAADRARSVSCEAFPEFGKARAREPFDAVRIRAPQRIDRMNRP